MWCTPMHTGELYQWLFQLNDDQVQTEQADLYTQGNLNKSTGNV